MDVGEDNDNAMANLHDNGEAHIAVRLVAGMLIHVNGEDNADSNAMLPAPVKDVGMDDCRFPATHCHG